jgi:hypothetical protein
MSEDIRRLLQIDTFPITEIPEWLCPVCKRGTLVSSKDNFRLVQSLESRKEEEKGPNGPIDSDYGYFTGRLLCNRAKCKQPTFVIGQYFVDENYLDKEDEYGHPEREIVAFLRPQLFQPTIQVMYLHHQVPVVIQKAFAKCFEQFWLDNDACGNKIRIVVELLMDDQGIPAAKMLGIRINAFNKKRTDGLGAMIESIKWIGNGGSHGAASLQRNDVVAAMEMLDFVTRQLYDTETAQKAQQLREYSARVNAAKGPIERNLSSQPPPPLPPPTQML